jgi:hypothetical protein
MQWLNGIRSKSSARCCNPTYGLLAAIMVLSLVALAVCLTVGAAIGIHWHA